MWFRKEVGQPTGFEPVPRPSHGRMLPLHHGWHFAILEKWYPRQELHLILHLRTMICIYYTTRTID